MNDLPWRVLLSRFGQPVRIHSALSGSVREVRAFLQPVLRKDEDQLVPSPVGTRQDDRFLYLGPANVPLNDGDVVEWERSRYLVQSAHLVGPETGGHIRAILRPEYYEEVQG